MDEGARRALQHLRFDWAASTEDVWRPSSTHVPELNEHALRAIMAAFDDADASPGSSPLSVAVVGEHGSGKTHVLGAAHQQVSHRGYFFPVSLHIRDFWTGIAKSYLEGLRQPGPDGRSQQARWLDLLANRLKLSLEQEARLASRASMTKPFLDEIIDRLERLSPRWGRESRHVARALVLLETGDTTARDLAESYLTGDEESVAGERIRWDILPTARPARERVRAISRLLALTGPTLLTIDQIDELTGRSTRGSEDVEPETLDVLDQFMVGLMDLRDTTARTATVVACQPHSWEQIRRFAIGSALDRFEQPEIHLGRIPSPEVGRALIAAWFAPRYEKAGFSAPYPTWPVLPQAFDEVVHLNARQLLQTVRRHVQSCLDSGELREMTTLQEQPQHVRVVEAPSALSVLDEKFATLVSTVDVRDALQPETENTRMSEILEGALNCYAIERAGPFEVAPRPGGNPWFHAQLRQPAENAGADRSWSFRAIATTSAPSSQRVLKRVQDSAGLDPAFPHRRAYVLRTGNWPTATLKAGKRLADFRKAGGVLIDGVSHDDLKVFAALTQLRNAMDPEFDTWLRARTPASRTTLFRAVFGAPGPSGNGATPAPEPPSDPVEPLFAWPPTDQDSDPAPLTGPEPEDVPAVPLGTAEDGTDVRGSLLSLRKHTAVFAGSGSGKTVLLRRLIEECALQGVSSIVLDPNNDLARLGDRWPAPPPGWRPGDAVRAERYLRETEVVVWTPRVEGGRPLSFQPLPDLATLVDDPDEFGQALETAVAALAPRARVAGATAKADRAQALLREVLTEFAHRGGGDLEAFLDLLADLPEGITSFTRASTVATDLAETLRAAVINDPLFGGRGTAFDPAALLTPTSGKRARISVISLVGLPGDQQRQGFVNQLQMALFAWIKNHPAGDRPLRGLFVMDEAQTLAPSGAMTACTASTLALVSQARKYGLGLVFATQAPKGIHNRIVGNTATQYFGFINSPVQVAAAKEMAAQRGSSVVDISRLGAGEFYLVTEGEPFRRISSPMCLSHHPSSALTPEEVVTRARIGR
ncbi:helicase HerA domain-containing protein [Amycolatopsis sp.]|uniref:helicase HerA domain-containing protein n=1 Tax=Amycolatopsis sp. TaxID=37632 RepID=UPI002D810D0D|nr:AAA family ATPase [Amycolatopsis sp.]HET6711780.1 AAA family ATPase [Amycolatopsis sp.]